MTGRPAPAPYTNDPAATIDPDLPVHPRTPAPELEPQMPLCPLCIVEVDHNGDCFECRSCGTVWDSETGPGEPSEQHPQCLAACEPSGPLYPRRRRYRCVLDYGHAVNADRIAPPAEHQGVDVTDPWSVQTVFLHCWRDGDHPDPGPPVHGPARRPGADRPAHPRAAPLPRAVVTADPAGGRL